MTPIDDVGLQIAIAILYEQGCPAPATSATLAHRKGLDVDFIVEAYRKRRRDPASLAIDERLALLEFDEIVVEATPVDAVDDGE